MAQHIPIEYFPQKQVKKIAEAIRKENSFKSSFKFQKMDDMYMENDFDEVYETWRRLPKSIYPYDEKATLEVHTRPSGEHRHKRIATNIYLVA